MSTNAGLNHETRLAVGVRHSFEAFGRIQLTVCLARRENTNLGAVTKKCRNKRYLAFWKRRIRFVRVILEEYPTRDTIMLQRPAYFPLPAPV